MSNRISKISQSEVVRISDLPELANLHSDAIFIASQNGKTNKVAFQTIKNNFTATVERNYVPRFANIESSIDELNKRNSIQANTIQKKFDEIPASINAAKQSVYDNMSQKIGALQSHVNVLDSQLKQYDINGLKQQVQINGIHIKNANDSIAANSAQLIDKCKHITDELAQKCNSTIKEANSLKDAFLNSQLPSIKSDIDALSAFMHSYKTQFDNHEQYAKNIIADVNSNVQAGKKDIKVLSSSLLLAEKRILNAASDNLSDAKSTMTDSMQNLSSYVERTASLYDEELASLKNSVVNVEQHIKKYDSKQLSEDVASLSASAIDLDIKLYGLTEQVKTESGVINNTIFEGDIIKLSNEIQLLNASVEALKQQADSIVQHTTIMKQFDNGKFAIDENQTKVVVVEILHEDDKYDYYPIQIVDIHFHDTDINALDIMNKYIVDRQYARIEIRNNTNEKLEFRLTSSVIYQNLRTIK